MSFPTQYIKDELAAAGGAGASPSPSPGQIPGLGPPPVEDDVQMMDPVPGEAVDALRQTRRSVALIGAVSVTIGLLFTVPAATFAVLKWDADNALARQLALAALGGFAFLLPALCLSAYARRIRRLINYPTGDLLASALSAQKTFWRIASLLLMVTLLLAAGLAGKFVWSKGVRTVSDDVRSRVMALVGKPTDTPADAAAGVAATQPSATQPAATQPAVAATPAESTPPAPPVPSGQASVETGESHATDK
jgi:hypothetical protein